MTQDINLSDGRLFAGLRIALNELDLYCSGAQPKFTLASAHALLDELELRTDAAFYGDYLQRGLALLRQAADSLRDSLSAPQRLAITGTLSEVPQQYSTTSNYAVFATHIDRLRRDFSTLAVTSAAGRSSQANAYISKAIAWERELFARCGQYERPTAISGNQTLSRAALEEYLRAKFPERQDLRVTDFTPLVGGFQKLTILFTTHDRVMGEQSLVLRGEQPDRFILLDLGGIPDEYEFVRLVFDAGLPLAEPLWLEADASLLGRRFMVSRKASGSNYGSAVALNRELEPAVARSLVTNLARLNSIPVAQYSDRLTRSPLARWLEYKTMAENTRACIHYWHDQLKLRHSNASPSLELISRWLLDNVPEDDLPPSLLHCDYGPHNVLVHNGEVSAVLDWESARIGDPAEDIANLIHATAGRMDAAQALRWYEEASGIHVNEFRLRYFDVHATMKLLLSCNLAASLYESDPRARNEWLLLALKWGAGAIDTIEPKIAAAEAARQAGR